MQDQLFTTILTGGTSGLIAMLLLAIIAILKGWVVPGYIYKKVEEKLTRYESMSFSVMAAVEKLGRGEGAA